MALPLDKGNEFEERVEGIHHREEDDDNVEPEGVRDAVGSNEHHDHEGKDAPQCGKPLGVDRDGCTASEGDEETAPSKDDTNKGHDLGDETEGEAVVKLNSVCRCLAGLAGGVVLGDRVLCEGVFVLGDRRSDNILFRVIVTAVVINGVRNLGIARHFDLFCPSCIGFGLCSMFYVLFVFCVFRFFLFYLFIFSLFFSLPNICVVDYIVWKISSIFFFNY